MASYALLAFDPITLVPPLGGGYAVAGTTPSATGILSWHMKLTVFGSTSGSAPDLALETLLACHFYARNAVGGLPNADDISIWTGTTQDLVDGDHAKAGYTYLKTYMRHISGKSSLVGTDGLVSYTTALRVFSPFEVDSFGLGLLAPADRQTIICVFVINDYINAPNLETFQADVLLTSVNV